MGPPRTITSVLTLLTATAVLVGMGWIGVTSATAPLPKFDGARSTSKCSDSEITRKLTVSRKEVMVSVFNAGAPKGFAGKTQDRLEKAGFRVGELGNAPAGVKYKFSVVMTTSAEKGPARLVAAALGPRTKVQETDEDYGPGVDVFVGSKQGGLRAEAPRKIKLDSPKETCVRVK